MPLSRPDWAQFVQVLRSEAASSYQAAEAKSQDDMVTASYFLMQACDACHDAYRDKYKSDGGKKVCIP